MVYFVILLFSLGLFLEATVTQVPFTFSTLLILFVMKKSPGIFPAAFFLGVLLDILTLRTIGGTSLFFVLFLFLVYLYDRKYEINTLPFIAVVSFIGAYLFLAIFEKTFDFHQASAGLLFAVLLFVLMKKVTRATSKQKTYA